MGSSPSSSRSVDDLIWKPGATPKQTIPRGRVEHYFQQSHVFEEDDDDVHRVSADLNDVLSASTSAIPVPNPRYRPLSNGFHDEIETSGSPLSMSVPAVPVRKSLMLPQHVIKKESKPVIPTIEISKEIITEVTGEKYFVHRIAANETLQGVAVAYGVNLGDVKRKNKLFSNNDFFCRKSILIPCSPDSVRLVKTNNSQSSGLQLTPPNAEQEEAIRRFEEQTDSHKDVARYYLQIHHWNVPSAVKQYSNDYQFQQQLSHSHQTPPPQ